MPTNKRNDDKSQSQKFVDAAKEHGADVSEPEAQRALREIVKAPAGKPKKGPHKAE